MHKLERNLIDNILESEVKLGRIGTSLTLYYPGSSLAELLDCSEEELPVKLAEFPEKGTEYHRFTKESYRKMMNDMAEERKKR